jgi:hypothetical protein
MLEEASALGAGEALVPSEFEEALLLVSDRVRAEGVVTPVGGLRDPAQDYSESEIVRGAMSPCPPLDS